MKMALSLLGGLIAFEFHSRSENQVKPRNPIGFVVTKEN